MAIHLTPDQITDALPKVVPGLAKYLWLQAERDHRDLASDALYRRRFNGFYRVRRGLAWQDAFFGVLEARKNTPVTFAEALGALHGLTGRYEASFASKLVATLDPMNPVIDSVVLQNLGLRLPAHGSEGRQAQIVALHARLTSAFNGYLSTAAGRALVQRFRESFPDASVTEVKILDFVLWQTRPTK